MEHPSSYLSHSKISWRNKMIYINRIMDGISLDLESLTSLIELSKGADIATHQNFIREFDLLMAIYKVAQMKIEMDRDCRSD